MNLDFDFEHDFDSIPMTATITVTCDIIVSHGSYYEPASTEASDISYTIMCGKVNVTEAILYGADQTAHRELENIVEDKIWEQYEN